MLTLSPASLMFIGVLILAFIGLVVRNLRLQNLLAALVKERDALPPAPVPPPPVVEAVSPPPVEPISPPVKTEPPPVPGARELDWQRRLGQAEHQLHLVQQELAALSYSVSHDLRAPLRAIDGFSQALAEDYGHALDTTAQGYLQRVRVNVKHMASLIDDLLSLARLARAPMQREVVELGPLAEAIIAGLRKIDPERVVSLEIQPGLRAFADRNLVEAALRHLLGNAWKFTSRRPSAHLSLRTTPDGQDQGAREIVYEVRDDGAGFDMNYAGKLFGAFQRMHTTEEFPGNGIGLAAVQRIVRRHGGRVWAEAVPDQGTAIFFTLTAGEEARVSDLEFSDGTGATAVGASDATPVPLTSSPVL